MHASRAPLELVPAAPRQRIHVLSVDVEDYFQVEAFADVVPRESWDDYPLRVDGNTRRVLDLFDRHGARGTFFFLGWVADRFPGLVREVVARGHEVACHSYWHRPIYRLTPAVFREDTRRARAAIEQAAGLAVSGYRAPTWSITRDSYWALDVLAEEGFLYDSSIYPIRHDLYGVPGGRRFVHQLPCGDGRSLQEYPPATVRLAGATLPAAGGGYLRLFPALYTHWAFRQISAEGQPVVVYFHPWEIDPAQPRLPGRLRSRFRHYINLHRMERRLEGLLRRYRFQPFRDLPQTARAEPSPAALGAAAK
jgi:polysaccharide deacetylase family protein (PEP-CTERM system associated)